MGDSSCRFCNEFETLNHLSFSCPTTKVAWSIVARCIGADNIPNSLSQFWRWCQLWIPVKPQLHAFLLAAVCWAIWKARNDACFNAKLIHHPAEIICRACAFLSFWAGLHKDTVQDQIKEGVGMLLSLACQMLASQNRAPTRSLLPPPQQDSSGAPSDDEN